MPQRFFPTDADAKVQAVFGAVKRYDGKYQISCGVSGTMITFGVDRETLVQMRDLINEELALDEPKSNPLLNEAPMTMGHYALIQRQLVHLAHAIGIDERDMREIFSMRPQDIKRDLRGFSPHVRTRPLNPPRKR